MSALSGEDTALKFQQIVYLQIDVTRCQKKLRIGVCILKVVMGSKEVFFLGIGYTKEG